MRFLALLLFGACLFLSACAHGPTEPTVLTGTTAASLAGQDAGFWRALMRADVIYVGETHDDPDHHAFEARLIQTLARAETNFVVGWEMFDRSQQPLLDEWQHGRLTQAQLFHKTHFDRNWAAYSPWYGRILDETHGLQVKTLALNAPPALAHKVAQGNELDLAEKAALPQGFTTDARAFRNFARMMGAHPGVAEDSLKRFFAAQSLWDQTMATVILDFHARHPKTKVVVLTGRGHVESGYGVPYFVKQKAPQLRQLILLPRSGFRVPR